MSSIANLSVSEISDLIFKKDLSPVDLFSFYSDRINKLDSNINSFIEIFDNLMVNNSGYLYVNNEMEIKIKTISWNIPII